MQMFLAFDEDGDGLLHPSEFAAAVAALAATKEQGQACFASPVVTGERVGSADFVTKMMAIIPALRLSTAEVVQHIKSCIAARPSNFEKSVSDLRQLRRYGKVL